MQTYELTIDERQRQILEIALKIWISDGPDQYDLVD